MGATSVTGVGLGVAANLRGPGNNRDFFVPRVGPHAIASGSLTTAANVATVTFPEHLDLPANRYTVMLTTLDPVIAGHNVSVSAKTNNGAGLFTSFSIISEDAIQLVYWVIVSMGYGLEITP